jgi:hypothetical protein
VSEYKGAVVRQAGSLRQLVSPSLSSESIGAWSVGDGARAKCSKRPAFLWVEDEAVPLGSVAAVVLPESLHHHARDENILHTAGDLVTAHQVASGVATTKFREHIKPQGCGDCPRLCHVTMVRGGTRSRWHRFDKLRLRG